MAARRLGVVPVIATMLALFVGCGTNFDLRVPDPAVRYIAFGDSTIQGPAKHDFTDDLPGLLNEPPAAFTKEGRGGESAADGVDRLRSLLTRKLFPNAQVLIYWEGAASLIDFVQNHDPLLLLPPDDPSYPFAPALSAQLQGIQNSVESAVKLGQDAGLQVFVATYYPLIDSGLRCDASPLKTLLTGQEPVANQYLTQLNQRICQAASNRNAVLLDVAMQASSLHADSANYFNCNHLSAAGNDMVAQLFATAIREHPIDG